MSTCQLATNTNLSAPHEDRLNSFTKKHPEKQFLNRNREEKQFDLISLQKTATNLKAKHTQHS